MKKRTCVLIDDDKQDDIFHIIKEEGKRYGLEIDCKQFNVGNQERRDLLTNEEIDLEKVNTIFQNEFNGVKIDLLAFDWNISGSQINGPILIKNFNDNNIRVKVPKILYSGVLKEEIEKLCEAYRTNKNMPFKVIWSQINTLISSDIITFVSRDDYELSIVEQLRKVEDTIESSIEEELRKFPDFKFQNCFVNKSFKGKTFSEIARLLDSNENLRNDFTKEITQQVLDYLTEKL